MSGVEWRGAGVTRECTWSGTIPRMNLIVTALNANFNSVSSVFRYKRVCTIRVAKTKVLISFTVTAKLICVFVFAYAKSRFPHAAAHIIVGCKGVYIARTCLHDDFRSLPGTCNFIY